jgi:hypothetical protein
MKIKIHKYFFKLLLYIQNNKKYIRQLKYIKSLFNKIIK